MADGVRVRIISKRRLREFWESRKHDSKLARSAFLAWYDVTKNVDWANFGALKQTFRTADQVGNCVVFDVGNNRFRLIGRVKYQKGIVYVLRAMDHAEYDQQRWIHQCGCYSPPPPPRTRPTPPQRKG
jgi:mRNA interferase HigB